jgi:actin-related protein
MTTTFLGGDEVGAIVLDIGTHTFKAGYGGEDCPKVYESSKIDTENGLRRSTGTSQGIHKSAMTWGGASYKSSAEFDPKLLQSIMEYSFKKMLKVNLPESPLIMTEPNIASTGTRKILFETAFECLDVPAILTLRKALAACYSVGKSSGLVLDIGASHTSVTPVFEGFTLQRGIKEYGFAGNALDEVLENAVFHQKTEDNYAWHIGKSQILEDIKKQCLGYSSNSSGPASEASPSSPSPEHLVYELPDRTKVNLEGSCHSIPELLFDPNSSGIETHGFPGVLGVLEESIMHVDIDARKSVGSEIVVIGGSTLFKGFPERLQQALSSSSNHFLHRSKITAMPGTMERISASWLGCSIACSLSNFQHLWISKQQYLENGGERFVDKELLF